MEQFLAIAGGILGTVAILAGGMVKASEAWPSDWYWFARITRAIRPYVSGCLIGVAVTFKFLLVTPNGQAFTIWAYLVSGLTALALLVQMVDAYHKAKAKRGGDNTDG